MTFGLRFRSDRPSHDAFQNDLLQTIQNRLSAGEGSPSMSITAPTSEALQSLRIGGLGGVVDVVRRHSLAAYVGLAWGISGAYWLWMASQGQVSSPGGDASHVPGLFGPMLAAILVTGLVGGRAAIADLVARSVRWRVSPRWYLLAALPFGLFLLGVALSALAGGPVPTLDDLATYSGLPKMGLPLVVLAAFVANGLGEEVGWRGFAQPTLQRTHGLVASSLMVALVWALWHVPSFGVVETYRTMGLAIIPLLMFGLGSGAIVFGWLYTRSGGSILIVALAHLGLNMGSATLAGRGLPAAVATTGIMIWAAAIVITELRRSRSDARPLLPTIRDGFVRATLHSPLRAMVGGGVVTMTYRGRRTGRAYTTPVECVDAGDALLVFVGGAARKQWWRNLEAAPEVEVLVGEARRAARASVELGPAAVADAAIYAAARPRAKDAIAAADPLVMVRLEVV